MGAMYYKDRVEAGKSLAELLKGYKGQDIIIYALPRGGVVIAGEIAQVLDCPLDLVITRKIPHPYSPEYAIGAVSESGEIIVNPDESHFAGETWFKERVENEMREAKRRRKAYMRGESRQSAKNRIVIIADDGVATGQSIILAAREIKKDNPQKIIIAVPVSPLDTAGRIMKECDEFVCPHVEEFFIGAVGAYYKNFDQVDDAEVIEILKKFI